MNFNLFIQIPKPNKVPIVGYLSVYKNDAMFFKNDHSLLHTLNKPSITYASTQGMTLAGFEQYGTERNGLPKYRYQEWYLVFKQEEVEGEQ